MFCPRLAAGTGDPGNAFKKQWIYHLCIHPSDVDEFLLRTIAWQSLLEKTG